MNTIGIDVGARALRVAAAKNGCAEVLAFPELQDRLRVAYEDPPSEESEGGFRIASLKSVLDFERPFPPGAEDQSSIDALIALMAEVRSGVRERGYGAEVRCVLAAPPCSSQRQRSALRTSALRAGFHRVRLVDDTLAVLLDVDPEVETALVFAWGASDCSIGLYRRSEGGYRVLAQDGKCDQGGDRLDAAVGDAILARLRERKELLPGAASAELLRRVQAEAERPILAAGEPISVPLQRLLGAPAHPRDGVEIVVESGTLGALLERMTAEALRLVDEVLASARGVQLDAVVVAGGMARLASVRCRLEAQLGTSVREAGDDSVARGAVRYGQGLPDDLWRANTAPEAEVRAASVKPVPFAYHGKGRRRGWAALPNQRDATGGKRQKIGRNELCPCGSGRKYKKCCGAGP